MEIKGESIGEWFSEVEQQAKDEISKLGAEALAEIKKELPVVAEAAKAVLKQMLGLALQAVLLEAPKAISGREKFGNAVTNVWQSVQASGGSVLQQDVEMAVQGAYHGLQFAVSTP